MHNFRELKAMVLGKSVDDPVRLSVQLEASSIPVSMADCRICPDPCDQGHEEYPKKFDIDMETQMLGSVKPYRRQVVISTGKSDWEKEVTEAQGTLAAFLLEVQTSSALTKTTQKESSSSSSITGVFNSSDSTRIAIINGSHETLSDDCTRETVLLFPDYKVVVGVHRTLEGAQDLWNGAVDPALGRSALVQRSFKSWILPYSCVIMLCSHKRRDNRCAIAAPKLETTFIQSLEHKGWEVHTEVENPSDISGPLEDLTGTEDEKESQIENQLRSLSSQNKVLLLRNSHVGGHKYAGNCIIHKPQGLSVWYGRVTPHEVESIILNTIIGGKVLPSLLRGGLNIARPGCGNLHDW